MTTDGPEDKATAVAPAAGGEYLACQGVRVLFAGVHAIDGVDLRLEPGTIMGLIGTNGAGKSTLVNVISGYQEAAEGSVTLSGREVTRWSPSRLAKNGVVRTFQAGRLFPRLTALENVEVSGTGVGKGRRVSRARALELLERGGLAARRDVQARALPHGSVRILGILRALATEPRFMLLDEPAAGSNETESAQLLALMQWISKEYSVGLLIIEHDMSLIMRLCDKIQVLDHGKTIAIGAPAEVRANPEVIRAYLGSDAEGSDAAAH